jgi:outer membrane biosynthesis protein TonB
MARKRPTVLRGAMLMVALALGLAIETVGQGSGSTTKYEPAKATSTSDIAYPPQTRTPGMVTLDVSVDGSGAVQNIVAVRDVRPLTSAVESAVNGWKFSPAMQGSQSVPGVVCVDVVFNPFNPGNVSIPNKPLPPPKTGGTVSGVFQPPDVTTANYAVYPPNTVASGTVVLDVKVGPDGSAGFKILRGAGVLATAVTSAIKTWVFVPGTYEGKPVTSHMVVAYVFVSPAVGTM